MLRQTRRKENTVSRTRTLAASASAALIGAGLLATAPAQAAKSAPDNALHVMTLNLYLGGSLVRIPVHSGPPCRKKAVLPSRPRI